MKLIKLYEALLTEKTYDIDQDVDLLFVKGGFEGFLSDYNSGRKPFKREILNNEYVEFATFDSSILESEECKKAHAINPVTIECGMGISTPNFYNPTEKKLRVGIRGKAVYFFYDNNVIEDLPPYQQRMILYELTDDRVKQSIHHELSHWLDDSLHNSFLTRDVGRAMDYTQSGKSYPDALKSRLDGYKEINLTPHELQAQIHAIKSLKSSLGDKKWDTISLERVFWRTSLMSIHIRVVKDFGLETSLEWQKRLVTRMKREGLLGKQMNKFVRHVET